ncbi:DUF4062 domain-containing protein [Planctomycetota bacterium]
MAQASKTFRVFVSSTFSDMKAERNALQEHVWPKLRELCMQHGCRFQAIDLRWGVSQEAALDQQTMPICLEEIRRCQKVTPRPNFIVLLGQRYGWRPLPSTVPADEFEAILEHCSEEERYLLLWRDDQSDDCKGWYRRDDNAVPAEYVLLPREGEYEDAEAWGAVETQLRASLLSAAEQVGLPEEARVKYERSATEQEIIEGALQAGTDHGFCYFRTIDGMPTDARARDFLDLAEGGKPDAKAQARLDDLTARLRDHFPEEHIHDYSPAWGGDGLAEEQLAILCERVEANLTRVILEEIGKMGTQSALEQEVEAHHDFAGERAAHFVGRQAVLGRIRDYVASDESTPLVIHGISGSGKTAVVAHAWLRLREEMAQTQSIARFVGATPGASDLRGLLTSLCQELGVEQPPADLNELVSTFRDRLSSGEGSEGTASADGRVVIFLDALDQISDTDNARMLYWLPRELAPNVRLVLSALDEEGDAGECFDLAKRIWPASLVEVGALGGEDACTLLDSWLGDARRTLQPEQSDDVLTKFAACPRPLYLRLAFEEGRRWRSWDGLPGGPDGVPGLNTDVPGILEDLFWRLELRQNHGQVLVSRALGYLGAARNGLTEDEVLDLLSRDDDVMRSFRERSPASPEADCLPVVVWSRLLADAEPYMARRRADGTVVLSFYHRELQRAAMRRYLSGGASSHAHAALGGYFGSLPFWLDAPGRERPNHRKTSELPFHQAEAAQWDMYCATVTEPAFMEARLLGSGIHALLTDYALSQSASSGIPAADGEALELVRDALRLSLHVLSDDRSQLCSQLHGRLAGVDNCRVVGMLGHLRPSVEGVWLHPALPTLTRPGGPLLATLGSHRAPVTALAVSPDGCLAASASADRTVRLWELSTGQCAHVLAGHLDDVNAVLLLSRSFGTVAVTGAGRHEAHKAPLQLLPFVEKMDRRESTDNAIKIWDVRTGTELATLQGHTAAVRSLAASGRLLFSGADDRTIRAWDIDRATALGVVGEHNSPVILLAVAEGGTRLISCSENEFALWSTVDGSLLRQGAFSYAWENVLAVQPKGMLLALQEANINGDRYYLQIWDLSASGDGTPEAERVTWFERSFSAAEFLDDGVHVLIGGSDGSLSLIEHKTGKLVASLAAHEDAVASVGVVPNTKRVLSSSMNGSVLLWDLGRQRKQVTRTGHADDVNAIAMSPDGELAVSGSYDRSIIVWDTRRREPLRRLLGHARSVQGVAVTGDGQHVLSCSNDRTVRLWRLDGMLFLVEK